MARAGSQTLLLLVLLFVVSANSTQVESENEALTYLRHYGYIESPSDDQKDTVVSKDAFTEAIKEFQHFNGLKETGELDDETIEKMNSPRCGMKDKVDKGPDASKEELAARRKDKWNHNDITYKISKYSKKYSKSLTQEEIVAAFKVWSDHTPLTFTATKGKPDTDLRFEVRDHGDGDSFDGPSGILAHALFPSDGGWAHFDDEESWTSKSRQGINFLQVAAHEIGHTLGLYHSNDKSALMAPFYAGYQPNLKLGKDDIRAIQALYGKKKTGGGGGGSSPPKGGSDEGTADGELCKSPAIDAIFSDGSQTFVFKGEKYWELTDNGLASGYPRSITKKWKGGPASIDAAFLWPDTGKTYFFKDSQFWRFTGNTKDRGYPKSIKGSFNGIPDKVDAAIVWGSENKKVYFFKGSKYWRYDSGSMPTVGADYPKDISKWSGVPSNLNAAFQSSNGNTYFFKGSSYWRFNDKAFKVEKSSPPFPRSTSKWWYRCKSSAMIEEKHHLQYNSLIKDTGDEIYISRIENEQETMARSSAVGNKNYVTSIVVGLFVYLIFF